MKILLVSWSILPYKGGSSIIVENLARNFGKDELYVFGSRRMQMEDLPARPQNGPEFQYFLSEMSLNGRGQRFFEWFGKARFSGLVKTLTKIIREKKIDYVIGVYPNAPYCRAACLAAKKEGVRFSSYFHNTYVENVAIKNPDAPKIQEEIFKASEYVFVMSKGMEKFYEEKYGLGKFVPLVHTFNEYPDQSIKTGIPGAGKKQYKLVAIGNFNESNLDATRRLVNAIKDNDKYSLSLFTHVPPLLLRNRGVDTNAIIYEGYINPDDVHKRLQEYDIFVLTHGFAGGYGEVEYKTIFPTRTIPFLLAGKPIFAHSPSFSFLNDFLKENGCAEIVETQSEADIIQGLDKIADDEAYQNQLISAGEKTAELFYGPKVVEFLKETLQLSKV